MLNNQCRYLVMGLSVGLGISLAPTPASAKQPATEPSHQAIALFRPTPVVAETIAAPLIDLAFDPSSPYLRQQHPADPRDVAPLKLTTAWDTNFPQLPQLTPAITAENRPITSSIPRVAQLPTAPIADANTSLTAADLFADAIAQDQVPATPLPPTTDSEAPSAKPDPEAANKADQTKDLAAQSQNPIASLTSVPFQNNTNFGVGQFNRTSNFLNIQPVIPVSLSPQWNLINRTIIPVAYQPELAPDVEPNFGLGDITYQGYFVPTSTGSFTWGFGPTLLLPTATATSLGTGQWGAGPGVVGLVSTGKIVTGALINNVWSFAGDSSRSGVSLMTIQPFFNYNFERGWYVSTSPIITANWLGEGEKWTIPIGGGFGRVFKLGKQPVNVALQAYWNAIKPEGAPDWTLRFQVNLLFPK